MGDPWGFGGGGEKPNIKQIVKKKIGQKISKIGEIGKKIGKVGFFFLLKNGLKCIRNPTKHL